MKIMLIGRLLSRGWKARCRYVFYLGLVVALGTRLPSCFVNGQENAQDVPQVSGIILDDGGNAVPGAFVVLYQGGNRTRTVRADHKGQFSLVGEDQTGQWIISAERLGYVTSDKSQERFSRSNTDLELVLNRETSKSGDEKIRMQYGELKIGSGLIAAAIFHGNPTNIAWRLERKTIGGWEKVASATKAPSDLFDYKFVADDVNNASHAGFRLIATIQYENGNDPIVVPRTFLVSSQSQLIDGEP
jgi:hypothetical protein